MSVHILVSLSAFIGIKADYKSYDGVNCGYVYDNERAAIYPLDVCITDYEKGATNAYKSREYSCVKENGIEKVEEFTYYNSTCTGTPNGYSASNKSESDVYNCGSGNVNETIYDDCYLEYKAYSGCNEWETSSYTTEYIMVGTCIDGVEGKFNQYSRCTDTSVEYVRFNDAQCCDLSYVYTSSEGPRWRSYDIQIGCNNDVYISESDWKCLIPDGAKDENVFTDNTDEKCNSASSLFKTNIMSMLIIAIAMLQ